MSVGAGMEVGQQEASFTANTVAQTTNGIIGLMKEVSREKSRTVQIEMPQTDRTKPQENSTGQEAKPPEEIRIKRGEPPLDGFAMSELYRQTGSKKAFLQMLLQVDAVKKNLRAMEYIRKILSDIRKYSFYYYLGVTKGIFAEIFPGDKKRQENVPARWENTEPFQDQMKELWEILGVDQELCNDPEIIRQREEILTTLEEKGIPEELLSYLETTPEGQFALPRILDEQGETLTERPEHYVILSPERYERYTAYAQKHPLPIEQALLVIKELPESGDLIVDPEHPLLQEFLKKEQEERIRTMEAEPKPEKREDRDLWIADLVRRSMEIMKSDYQTYAKERDRKQAERTSEPGAAEPSSPVPGIPPVDLSIGQEIER